MALNDAFSVKVNGNANPVQDVDVGGTSVTLVVQNRIQFGDTITVSYDVPVTSKITDRFGNELASFADKSVDNELPDPSDTDPPIFEDAATDEEGREISISFDEPVLAAIPPEPVRNLGELDSGEDTENANRYFIQWRWSPGLAGEDNAHDFYQYRFREVTTPASAWGNYVRNETGEVRLGNLKPNATYEIEVVASNVGGNSDPVTDVADTPIVSSGKAPINFRVTDKGRKADGSAFKFFMEFAFSRDSTDTAPLTRYEYRSKETSGSAWTGWVDNGTDLTFEIDSFSRNTSYDIEVRLVNFIGVSDAASVTDMITFNKPDAATNVAAAGSRTGMAGSYAYQLAVTWEYSGDSETAPVDGFSIQYRENTVSSWTLATNTVLAADARAYTITGLDHTKQYDIRVNAANSVGVTRTRLDDIAAFTKPGPVTMVTCAHVIIGPVGGRVNQVVYGWQLPPQDGTNTVDDVLIRTRKSTGSWGAFTSQGATTTTHTIMNADDNTTYEIEVKTRNSAGDSAVATESCEVKTLRTISAPEAYVYSSSGLIQATAFGWTNEDKWAEFEYHLGGENSFRPLQDAGTAQRLVTLPADPEEFDFVFASAVLGTPAPDGTTFSGTMVRIRFLNASKEPTTEWGVIQATEL